MFIMLLDAQDIVALFDLIEDESEETDSVHLSFEEFYRGCRLHTDDEMAGKTCPVCLDPLDSRYRRIGTCGHSFHDECLRDWLLEKSTTCPVCRQDARPQSGTRENSDLQGNPIGFPRLSLV